MDIPKEEKKKEAEFKEMKAEKWGRNWMYKSMKMSEHTHKHVYTRQ